MSSKRRRIALAVAACAVAASAAAVLASAGGAAQQGSGLVNTSTPVLSGTAKVGETLTTTNGKWTWDGTPLTKGTYAYAWRSCDKTGENCVVIPGQTKYTYIIGAAETNHTIRAYVTASFGGQSKVAISNHSGIVSNATGVPANTAKPTISGTPQQGSTLTAHNGTWTGAEPITYAYQWQRCDSSGSNCGAVPGATTKTIALGSDDVNKRMRVRVTAKNSVGSANAQSAATSAVAASAGPGGAVDVNSLPSTERLSTDPVKFIPSKITSTAPFQLQVTVVDLKGQKVSGALVYALGVPYKLIKEAPEVKSDSSGIATITLYPTSSFPKSGTLQIFVRVRRASDPDLLTGISNRRLIQVTINIK
jgi:hypothetical protein